MPRCRYGTYLTLGVVIYGLMMVFLFSKHSQQPSTVFRMNSGDHYHLPALDDKNEHDDEGKAHVPREVLTPKKPDTGVEKAPEAPDSVIKVPERPADKPAERLVERPADKPVERLVERPADKPVERLVERPAERPAERPVERPAERLVENEIRKVMNEREANPPMLDAGPEYEEFHPGPKLPTVLIVTYMRCGSSLTGDLIQQHPDVFYVYEPLWQTQHNYMDGKPTVYLNGTSVNMDRSLYWTADSESVRVVHKVIRCQFDLLDVGSLKQPHMRTSKKTLPYIKCQRSLSNKKPKNDTTAIRSCLGLLIKPCLRARVRAIKVIRFTMVQLERFMEKNRDVKVIYLLRDPRGSLNSQSRVGEFKWRDVKTRAINFCGRVTQDMSLAKNLTLRYPNQILTVRYEEIAEHPQAAAEFMYNFIGLKMSDTIREYIWNITFAGKNPTCQICTTRTNATETAYKWRNRMSFTASRVIQEVCSNIFETMGYRKFMNLSELLNRTISNKYPDFGNGFMVMKPYMIEGLTEKSYGKYNRVQTKK